MSTRKSVLPPDSRFHHVGIACRDLAREESELAAVGYARVGETFTDPRQGVVGVFLEGGGPRLELVAPQVGSDVLEPWLAGRAKMYHLAYEVPGVTAAITAVDEAGGRLVSAPTPAVAFGERPVCFVMLPNRLLVEFIESSHTGSDVAPTDAGGDGGRSS